MTEQQPSRDEMPQPMPDDAGQPTEEAPAFRDWQNRLGPRHQPGSPTSPGNFLYLGREIPRPQQPPPPRREPPPSE